MNSYFQVAFWMNKNDPVKRWYTPADDENRATFRVGPFAFSWEMNRHD